MSNIKKVLKDIANAIRRVKGMEDDTAINPQNFDLEVFSISSPTLTPNMVDIIGSGLSNIININIGDDVLSIESNAFKGMSSITSLSLNKVKEIQAKAFNECKGLSALTIPESTISIAPGAFLGCNKITSIKVEEENTVYESRNCNAIIEKNSNTLVFGCKNTDIDNSNITNIGTEAYAGTNLSSFKMPSNIEVIGNRCFMSCTSLTTIDFTGSELKDIGTGVLQGCGSLTTVMLPENLEIISINAFLACSSLAELSIPSTVTIIREDAFRLCTKLRKLDFSNHKKVPTLSSASTIYKNENLKIIVPSDLLEEWRNAPNWSDFSSYITDVE